MGAITDVGLQDAHALGELATDPDRCVWSRSSPRRASVQRTAAIRSGSSARSENSHGSDVHRPTGTCRRTQSDQSIRPRGVARTSRRGMNVTRRRTRRASSRRMTGPAISQEGTSRAEPGTSAPPPTTGAIENPIAPRTSPRGAPTKPWNHENSCDNSTVAGETSGPAPIRPEGRNNMCRPLLLWTSGVKPRRCRAGRFAARKSSQSTSMAWSTEDRGVRAEAVGPDA